jgi:hypothetical protein
MKNNCYLMLFFTILQQITFAQSAPKSNLKTMNEYANAFSIINKLGVKLDMSLENSLSIIPDLKKSKANPDFRDEYTYDIHENGLQNLTFYFDKDNHAPMYEVILEFEDADTLAALCTREIGVCNHPSATNHWILNLSPDGIAFILWRFENKLIMAANLADTEFSNDAIFKFDGVFVENFLTQKEITPEAESELTENKNTEVPQDQRLTLILNKFIENASTDFEKLKGEPIEGKKDEFYATIIFNKDPKKTIIRKKSTNSWRLEAKTIENSTLEMARQEYINTILQIEALEALNYRLIKKSEYSTNTGKTYLWEVQNLDGITLNTILKLQLYAAGGNQYSVKLEVGK